MGIPLISSRQVIENSFIRKKRWGGIKIKMGEERVDRKKTEREGAEEKQSDSDTKKKGNKGLFCRFIHPLWKP